MIKHKENNKLFDRTHAFLQRFDIVNISTGGSMSTNLENQFEVSANYTTESKYAIGAAIGVGGSFILLAAAVIATVRAGDYVLGQTHSPAFALAACAVTGAVAFPAFVIGTKKVAKIASRFGFE
jgi:hypothetical protein